MNQAWSSGVEIQLAGVEWSGDSYEARLSRPSEEWHCYLDLLQEKQLREMLKRRARGN